MGRRVPTPCHRNTGAHPGRLLNRLLSYRLPGMLTALVHHVNRNWMFALLAMLGMMPGTLQSATLQRLSLDDMIIRSNSIVRGKVTDSWAALTGSVIYTHYRIQVSENLKGPKQSVVEIMF